MVSCQERAGSGAADPSGFTPTGPGRSRAGDRGSRVADGGSEHHAEARRPHLLREVALGAAGIAVGLALALVVPGWLDDDPPDVVLPVAQEESVAADLVEPRTVSDVPGAGSATAAVEGFLAAEQAGDLAASFAHLSDEDRRDIPDPATWTAVHADLLAPVQGYEIGGVEAAEGGVRVASTVRFEPSLDEFRGLVPGTAQVSWLAVEDANGWRISLAGSTLEPVYPGEEAVEPAAERWLAEGAACDPGAATPPTVSFLGSRRDLVDALCSSGGSGVGPVGRLEDPVARTDLVAAFGVDAGSWARVVAVDGAVDARLVLAPVGEDWVVVDVIAGAPR